MASSKQPPTLKEVVAESVAIRPAIFEKLGEWIDNSKSIDVLIAGKAGNGKSTLINGLVGKNVSKEGHNLTPETSRVQRFSLKVDEVTVQLYDSPGLQDATSRDDKYTAQMKATCNNVDLFLYCIRMSETRLFPECTDVEAMKTLYAALGQDLWKNCLIVLTFANDLLGVAKDKKLNVTEYFRQKYERISARLRELLQDEVKIDPSIVSEIPIVCAGHVNKPLLPSVAPEDVAAQRENEIHWLSHLWLKALNRTKHDAQPAMIKLNLHRILQNSAEYSIQEMAETAKEIIEMQPLMLGQQGAEIGKDLGENGRGIGLELGIQVGHRLAAGLGIRFVILLLLNLGLQHGHIVRLE